MLKAAITVIGRDRNALKQILEEVLRLIEEGDFDGKDYSDDGKYRFSITGKEEADEDEYDRKPRQ